MKIRWMELRFGLSFGAVRSTSSATVSDLKTAVYDSKSTISQISSSTYSLKDLWLRQLSHDFDIHIHSYAVRFMNPSILVLICQGSYLKIYFYIKSPLGRIWLSNLPYLSI